MENKRNVVHARAWHCRFLAVGLGFALLTLGGTLRAEEAKPAAPATPAAPAPVYKDAYEEGCALITQGKFSEAADKLRQFILKEPATERSRTARFQLAHALASSGLTLQATETYADYLRNFPDDKNSSEARYLLARSYEAQGKFPEAVDGYNRFIQRESGIPSDRVRQARLHIGEIYDYVLQQPNDALREYLVFAKAYPSDPLTCDVRFRTAAILDQRLHDTKAAIEAYTALVKDYPQDRRTPDAQLRLSDLWGDGGMGDIARYIIERKHYIELFPNRPDIQEQWLNVSQRYRDRLNQQENAREAADQALKIKRVESIVWEYRQEAIWRSGKTPAIYQALQDYLQEFPNGVYVRQAQQRMADVLNRMNKKDDAIRAWEALIEKYPADCQGERWECAIRYEEKGNWQKELEVLSAMTKMDISWPGRDRFDRMVRALTNLKNAPFWDQTEALLKEALTRSQHIPEQYCAIQWTLGNSFYLDHKNYPKALECFHSILDRMPFDDWYAPNAIASLVRAYREQKNLPGAVEDLRAFHKKNPRCWYARDGRALAARLLLELKDVNGALAEATQVMDPALDDHASADATLTAAECWRTQGNEMKALALYTQIAAFRLEPRHDRLNQQIDSLRSDVLKPLLLKYGGEPANPAPPAKPPATPPAKPAPAPAAPAPTAPKPAPGPADLLKRAMLYHAMGMFSKALEDYTAFEKTGAAKDDVAAQVETMRADADRLSKFAAYYDGGELEKLPTMSLTRRGQDYADQRRLADALNAWRLCLKRSPLHTPARISIAYANRNLGVYAAAGEAFLEMLSEVPSLPDGYRHDLAHLWYYYWHDTKYTETVRKILRDAADQRPDPRTYYWVITVSNDRDPRDGPAALKYAQAYADLKGIDLDTWYAADRITDCHMRANEPLKAVAFGRDWIKAHPNNHEPDMLYRIGEALRQAKQDAQAVATFQDILNRFPTNGWAREGVWRSVDSIAGAHQVPMLEQFIKANPNQGACAEAMWRLVNRLPPTDARRVQLCQDLWTNYRTKWAENMYSSYALMNSAIEKKQPDVAARVAQEMIDTFQGTWGEVANAFDCLLRYTMDVKKDDPGFLRLARQMSALFVESRDACRLQQIVSDYYMKKGDPLSAAAALHWGVASLPRNDPWSLDEGRRVGDMLAQDGRYEEAATLVRTAMSFNHTKDPERTKNAEKFMTASLTQSTTGGVAVIDMTLPQAGLLMGDVFARAGEENLAWQKFQENRKLFDQFRHDLSPAYIRLIAGRLLDGGEMDDVVDLCRSFIMRRKDDKRVTDSDRAAIQLILGDCYFRQQRFDLARLEYTTCANLYPKMPQAVQAQFKIGECYMAQKMFDKADQVFSDLAASTDEDTVVRAMLMQGFLYHSEGKQAETIEQFKKVLAQNPKDDLANEVFFRLGNVYQESGKLQEAYNLYRLVGSGGREAKRYVVPGQKLLFRLSDKDLNITRGGTKVPILVETSSGDREQVLLQVSEAGSGIFVGEIQTALGKIVPGDHVLQVRGNDTITYRYDPAFAQDFVTDNNKLSEDRVIRVASDADLEASGMDIKEDVDEEAEAQLALRGWTAQYTPEGRYIFRRPDEFKPGNNIYVRLINKALDVSDEVCSTFADVAATSGDTFRLKLTETAPHTGIFRGTVPTCIRPPDASASDYAEGHDPSHAIDGNPRADAAWEGTHDGRVPKWLMADLKEIYPVTRILWNRGAGRDDRVPLRYTLLGSVDNANWQYLAIMPSESAMLTNVKAVWEPDSDSPAQNMLKGNGDVKTCWIGRWNNGEWIVDLDLGGVTRLAKTVMRPSAEQYREVRRYVLFVEKEKGRYPGQNRSNEGWRQIAEKTLDQPKVDETALKDVEARYIRIHIRESFRERAEIGEFEVYPAVLPFKATPAVAGKGATIEIPPTECRYVKMLIQEYQLDAPAIAEFAVWAGDKKIVPPDPNAHKQPGHEVLEVSPGDTVTVSYLNEVSTSGESKVVRKTVRATYYDGTIRTIRHFFFDDDQGNRYQVDREVYRVDPGDRFIVEIRDYDCAVSDGIDTVPFTVESTSGQKLSLTASETSPTSGVFTKEVDTSSVQGREALVVKPGDKLSISYIDRENNNPGHAVARTTEVEVTSLASSSVTIRETGRPPKKAPNPGEKAPTLDPNRTKLVSLEQPLTVEVRDPTRARNSGDTVTVHLQTTGGDAADVECFVAGAEKWRREDVYSALKEGLFVGEIRLALGDKNSPKTVVEALRVDPRRYELGMKKRAEVPVLNISGSDTITALYQGAGARNDPANPPKQDTARLVTNAALGVFDDRYENPVATLHVGENMFIKVEDADMDVPSGRNTVMVRLEGTSGGRCTAQLTETLSHSGIFTGAVPIEYSAKPNPQSGQFEADFGDTVTVLYTDERNTESPDPVVRKTAAKIVTGSDGTVMGFGKKYPSPEIAVDTEFKIGECYFYLGRNHMKLAEETEVAQSKEEMLRLAREELSAGQRILEELLRAYPDSEKLDQAAYLLGCLAQEQQRHDEAIDAFRRITVNWPESPVAAEAQYKIGMCYEKKGDFDTACDEYVRLAYKYPDSMLVGDAMVRIGLHFFEDKKYTSAVNVFQKFIEKYPLHSAIEEVWFKMGLALILDEKHLLAADHFVTFVDKFPESKLKAAALYWGGDSYLKAEQPQKAYQMFKRVVWDFPESKWAKWARGKLTAPVFERME